MRIRSKNISWVGGLATVAACGFFAARGTSTLVAAQIYPSPSSSQLTPEKTENKGQRDPAGIISRNLFCSSCENSADNLQVMPLPSLSSSTLDLSADLVLVATLVSKDPTWCFAAIRERSTQQTNLHRLGSRVMEALVVEEVEAQRVKLAKGKQVAYLLLDPPVERKPGRDRPVRPGARPMDGLAAGIKRVAPRRYEVQRSTLERVLSNTTTIGRSGQIVPSVKDGRSNGFKLRRIRPGSLYTLLGFESGDTVHAINGHKITTPDTVLPIYVGLRRARHVTISFTRRGKTSTHEYTIR
jgi:general secretion pathway protein C